LPSPFPFAHLKRSLLVALQYHKGYLSSIEEV
jgi:hypothetical protein